MAKGGILLATLFIISILLSSVGCATVSAPDIVPAPQLFGVIHEEAKAAQLTEIKEDWMIRWEKVISSAKKEGKLVVYSTTGGEMRDVVGRAFKEKYGIEAEFMVRKGSEIAVRLSAERRAGLYIPDIYLGGAPSAITLLKPQGYFVSAEPALILPEVIDPRLWVEDEFPWIDKDHTIVGFIAQANVPLAVNTNLDQPEEITSYKDLLKPKCKGKILMNDVTLTSTGGGWFARTAYLITGLEFMRDLANQEPVMITNYRLQLEWLAQGKYPILVAPHSPTLTEFIRAGDPVIGVTPIEGTYRTSASGNVALFNRAPNPDAAKLFMNWLLSKEGQKVYVQMLGLPSARLDVPLESVTPNRILDPKIRYVNGNSEENLLKQKGYLKPAREIFGHLKK